MNRILIGRKYSTALQAETVIRAFGVGVDYAGTFRSLLRKAAVVLSAVCIFFLTLVFLDQIESEGWLNINISDGASVVLIYVFFAIILIPLFSLYAEHLDDHGSSIVAIILLFPTTFWALCLSFVITKHLPQGLSGTLLVAGSLVLAALVCCTQVVCLAAQYSVLRRTCAETFSKGYENENVSLFKQ